MLRPSILVLATLGVLLLGGCGEEAADCTVDSAEDAISLSSQEALDLATTGGQVAVAVASVEGEVPGHRAGDQWNVVVVELEDGTTPVFGIATLSVGFGRSALNRDAEAQGWGTQRDVDDALSDLVPVALGCLQDRPQED